MLRLFLAALILAGSFAEANAQASGGSVTPEGVIVPGNCTKFGTTKFKVADAGAPCGAGGGGVTSVGLALPSIFTVSGSPVTTSGTLTGTLNTQSANTIFAGPASGIAATPTFRALVAADVPSSILPGGFTGFANPTASVGLTAVNGSATTAMRSDGAPALDQAAAYAFTALGNTTLGAASLLTANTIQPRAVTALQFNRADGTNIMAINTSGHLIWNTTATYDIGTAGSNKPNNIYAAGTIKTSGTGSQASVELTGAAGIGSIYFFPNSSSVTGKFLNPSDGFFQFTNGAQTTGFTIGAPSGTATLQFGPANAASPVAQTLQAQGSRAGTDSNVGGAALTITSGNGTGIGTRSVLTLQSPVIVASGTGTQTQTTGWRIDGGTAVSTGYTVAGLPATPLAGARAHVTDQLTTCAGIGVALTGGGAVTCPAFYNGTAWVGG